MAQEKAAFDFDDVANAISDKMIRRHPHVFGDAQYGDSDRKDAVWEGLKAQERAAKGADRAGVLDDVPAALPALLRAAKLTKRAARVGFDWPDFAFVFDKLREEMAELEVEIEAGELDKARAEFGDVLFVCANLARKLDIDPEDALRRSNAKFIRRFGFIERELAARGKRPEQSTLAEMDALWDEAKALERG
jgi:tetrapyrrole methylase family protein/MazG family protein/ATP diphosphatase